MRDRTCFRKIPSKPLHRCQPLLATGDGVTGASSNQMPYQSGHGRDVVFQPRSTHWTTASAALALGALVYLKPLPKPGLSALPAVSSVSRLAWLLLLSFPFVHSTSVCQVHVHIRHCSWHLDADTDKKYRLCLTGPTVLMSLAPHSEPCPKPLCCLGS